MKRRQPANFESSGVESSDKGRTGDPVQRKATSSAWANQAQATHGNALVQREEKQGNGETATQVQNVASEGVSGAGSALPFQEQIQASFGSHDISDIRAHTGGSAVQAADAIGAEAYTTGTDIAFGGSADLHTAAHEAAHVVQQQAGVSLKGGLGQSGDSYEKHADAVADKVVAGDSAQGLLSSGAGGGSPGSQAVQAKGELPKGEEGFQSMWDAHPHNYLEDEEQNTSSDEVREEEGLPSYLENTCAIRLSIMLNNLGSSYRITPARAQSAGLKRRPFYTRKSGDYFILSAREMWTYLDATFRSADATFPLSGKWTDESEFNAAFEQGENPIRDLISSKKGIVAFDKIFGYSGTGHVDIFDGENLSDASEWYPSQRLRLWYIVP
jgi:hypothetical protein